MLKDDLAEIFGEIVAKNIEFKDNIFFKNLIDTEKKMAIMDKEEISHMNKKIRDRQKLKFENMNDLMKKYSNRAKIIVDED